MNEKQLVYGPPSPEAEDEIVFVPEALAVELASMHEALQSSSTWGEFRARLSRERRAELDERLDDEESESDPPSDEASFSADEIPGVADGDYPEWPVPEQVEWLPADVLKQYARVERTAFSGDYITFPAAQEEEIVAALAERGYACRRDDGLVLAANGRGD